VAIGRTESANQSLEMAGAAILDNPITFCIRSQESQPSQRPQ
jgi:hypothetical protein